MYPDPNALKFFSKKATKWKIHKLNIGKGITEDMRIEIKALGIGGATVLVDDPGYGYLIN